MDVGNNFPNNEAYLKDYEAKIREQPLDELYEILEQIENHPLYKDKTPERINIVKKRIRELDHDAPLEKAEKEALHAKVVEECEKNDDPRIALFNIISIIFLIMAFAYVCTEGPKAFIYLFSLGASVISYTISCVFKKVIAIRGARFYKAENAQGFKAVVGSYFLFGAFFFIAGILYLCGIWD